MASFVDYSAYLALFSPLLQQQSALFQANAQQASLFASYQAGMAALQERQRQEARERKVEHAQQQAIAAAQAEASRAAESTTPSEPIPHIAIYSPENRELTVQIESEWRWGSVCLFFEQFLPLYPRSMTRGVAGMANYTGFKPDLLLQSFMCQAHSCYDHKWDACSCPHPACQHLAELFLHLLLLLFPIPPGSKKLPKNQLNISNYLPILQQIIEKNYFAPNQECIREEIQEIMEIFIECEEEKKTKLKEEALKKEREERARKKQEAAEGGMDVDEGDEEGEQKSSSKSLKFSLPIHPPGSALLACHLHKLPARCKLYLLHFLCEYVLAEKNEMKEVCSQSNALFHAGNAAPAPAPVVSEATAAATEPSSVLPYNPFHSLGLSEPHGIDDDGTRYWCFVQEESGRIHLYQDKHTGAKSEFQVQLHKPNKPPRPALVTGYEAEEAGRFDEDVFAESSSDSSSDEEDQEPVPIDDAHAPPSFTFTLLTSDVQSVSDFVQIGLMNQKTPASLAFLQKLQSEVIPNGILMQKKLERSLRREKTMQAAQARSAAYAATGISEYSAFRSQRVRKQVNYTELNEGDIVTAGDDDEYTPPTHDTTPAPVSRAARASRRTSAAPSPAPTPAPSAHQPTSTPTTAPASSAPTTTGEAATSASTTTAAPSSTPVPSPSPVPSPTLVNTPVPAANVTPQMQQQLQMQHMLFNPMFNPMFNPYAFAGNPAAAGYPGNFITPAKAVVATVTSSTTPTTLMSPIASPTPSVTNVQPAPMLPSAAVSATPIPTTTTAPSTAAPVTAAASEVTSMDTSESNETTGVATTTPTETHTNSLQG